jgi:hypothetical protein
MDRGGSTAGTARGDVSPLLRAWSDGDRRALAQLTPIVYGELRRSLYRELLGRSGNGRRTLEAAG